MTYTPIFTRLIAQAIKLDFESQSDVMRYARRITSGEIDAREFARKIERREPGDLHHRSPWGGLPATYFMQMEIPKAYKPVKIGWSVDPEGRRYDMLTGTPYPITLLASFPECLLQEDVLHSRFASFRMRGEWFRPNRHLTSLIKNVAALNTPPSWHPKTVPPTSLHEKGAEVAPVNPADQ